MRTPIYIAGSSVCWQRSRDFAHRLQDTGLVEITGRWWDSVSAHGPGRDREYTDAERRELAMGDLAALERAAVVVLLWGPEVSEGRTAELGFVLGKEGVTTIAAGPDTQRNIHVSLVDLTIDAPEEEADERAFNAIVDLINAQNPRRPVAGFAGAERP